MRQEHTVTELAVTGAIPQHLDGRYLRHGPNPVAEIDPQTCQWLMGDGMVHGVRLRDWAAAAAATSGARQVVRARSRRRLAGTIAATGSRCIATTYAHPHGRRPALPRYPGMAPSWSTRPPAC